MNSLMYEVLLGTWIGWAICGCLLAMLKKVSWEGAAFHAFSAAVFALVVAGNIYFYGSK